MEAYMKKVTTLFTVILSCVFITWGSAAIALAQDTENAEFLLSLSQPGPEIKRLEALAGTWATTIKFWEGGEEAPAVELSGTAERKWILGGRYLEEITENATPDGVFQGRGYFGYNRAQGLYEFAWISTEDIEITLERGRIDPETNALVLKGGYIDVLSGFYIMRTSEFLIESPDRHVMTVFLTDVDGRSYKEFEIVFTRQ